MKDDMIKKLEELQRGIIGAGGVHMSILELRDMSVMDLIEIYAPNGLEFEFHKEKRRHFGLGCCHFAFQEDCNGDITVAHCNHEYNPSEYEGNCSVESCPIGRL